MTTFDAWRSYFVAPRPSALRREDRLAPLLKIGLGPTEPSASPASVAVLGREDVASAYGIAVGTRLSGRGRSRTAIVATWNPRGSVLDTSRPRARGHSEPGRVLTSLADDGFDGTRVGRIVSVGLAAEVGSAIADVQTLRRAAPQTPLVLVLAGARSAESDRILALADGVLVVAEGETDVLAELAVSRLRAAGFVAASADLPSRERLALIRRGLPLGPALSEAVDAACGLIT